MKILAKQVLKTQVLIRGLLLYWLIQPMIKFYTCLFQILIVIFTCALSRYLEYYFNSNMPHKDSALWAF